VQDNWEAERLDQCFYADADTHCAASSHALFDTHTFLPSASATASSVRLAAAASPTGRSDCHPTAEDNDDATGDAEKNSFGRANLLQEGGETARSDNSYRGSDLGSVVSESAFSRLLFVLLPVCIVFFRCSLLHVSMCIPCMFCISVLSRKLRQIHSFVRCH